MTWLLMGEYAVMMSEYAVKWLLMSEYAVTWLLMSDMVVDE